MNASEHAHYWDIVCLESSSLLSERTGVVLLRVPVAHLFERIMSDAGHRIYCSSVHDLTMHCPLEQPINVRCWLVTPLLCFVSVLFPFVCARVRAPMVGGIPPEASHCQSEPVRSY